MQFNGFNRGGQGFNRGGAHSRFSKPVIEGGSRNLGVTARLGPAENKNAVNAQKDAKSTVSVPNRSSGPARKPAPITAPLNKPSPISAPKPEPVDVPSTPEPSPAVNQNAASVNRFQKHNVPGKSNVSKVNTAIVVDHSQPEDSEEAKKKRLNRFEMSKTSEAPSEEAPKSITKRLGPRDPAHQQNKRENPRKGGMGKAGNRGDNQQDESGKDNRRDRGPRERRPYFQDNFWYRLQEIGGEQYDLEPLDLTEVPFNNQARIFCGSIGKDVTKDEIKELFSKYGEIGDIYHNKEGSFAFINLDYKANAEKAIKELFGTSLHGRRLLVRPAAVSCGVQVKNLSPTVTNELLHKAFSIFGKIETCRVSVDDRGKSIGSGFIVFVEKRSAVMAYKRCQEGAFFLTGALRPVIVEPWETRDNDEGFAEGNILKNELYRRERSQGPRFAETYSYEYEYAKKWKQLFEIYKEKKQALENDLKAEMEALEVKMQLVIHTAETEKLRRELEIREQEAKQLQMGLGSYGDNARPTQLSSGEDYGLKTLFSSNPAQKRSHDYYDDQGKDYQPASKKLYSESYRNKFGEAGGNEQNQQKTYANAVTGASGNAYSGDAGSYTVQEVDTSAPKGVMETLTAEVSAGGISQSGEAYSNYLRHKKADSTDVASTLSNRRNRFAV